MLSIFWHIHKMCFREWKEKVEALQKVQAVGACMQRLHLLIQHIFLKQTFTCFYSQPYDSKSNLIRFTPMNWKSTCLSKETHSQLFVNTKSTPPCFLIWLTVVLQSFGLLVKFDENSFRFLRIHSFLINWHLRSQYLTLRHL